MYNTISDMATYAIGDVHGCLDALVRLLEVIRFSPSRDRLWFVGDLTNRGPESLEVARFLMDLGDCITVVLGNHDLHFMGRAEGVRPPKARDTLEPLLSAPDCRAFVTWLERWPLLVQEGAYVLVHAGLAPAWTIPQAVALAADVKQALRGSERNKILAEYGDNTKTRWDDDLTGQARWQTILNALTRIRVCSSIGEMDLPFTGTRAQIPVGLRPWFEALQHKSSDVTVLCGHWSALGFEIHDQVICLDGGCVWNRSLVAVRLEDRAIFQVQSTPSSPGGDST